jgi:hypothetical protein
MTIAAVPLKLRGLAVLTVALAATGATAQTFSFTDQTLAVGVACSHIRDVSSTDQNMTAGGAAGDFNNDGWQDLFVLGGFGTTSARDRLFINNGNGTFTEQAAAWGVRRTQRGQGVAVGDVDNDGWLDIYVTVEPGATGYSFNSLYRNNHNGTFTDIAASSGVATAPGRTVGGGWGAAFGDYNLDGNLDLAVGDWTYPLDGNVLYAGLGDGSFVNVTLQAVGLSLVNSQGFSPRFADMNGDRYPELLWTSDFGGSKYLINNTNGTFTESTAAAGVGLDGNGMGTAVADVNGDGRPDWFVTSIYDTTPQPNQPGTGNMLYINQGNDHYTEVSQAAGVKQGGWGWGAIAEDLDHDGLIDLANTNGWPTPEFLADQTCVFRSLGSGPAPSFQQTAPACGVTHTAQGRGMITLDYDNDGDQDIVIFTNDGALKLYRNNLTGPDTHWLRLFFDTRATPTNAPNGYGVHVTALAGGVTRHRWLVGGSNYLSQSELSVHFGLGSSAMVDQLRVEWPDGRISTWSNVAADRTLVIRSCTGDFNRDGTSSVQDLFDFLAAYFSGNADINLSGATSLQDIFDFLAAWFGGCH